MAKIETSSAQREAITSASCRFREDGIRPIADSRMPRNSAVFDVPIKYMAYDIISTWPSGFTEVNGVKIHYRRAVADGPSLIALHGLMGSGAVWAPFVRALGGGFDVILPDARGHGRSSVPTNGYLYNDHADDVCELIRALGLNKPILMGHSMGGMTAALVASRLEGRIGGVVLVDPTFISPEWQREVYESDVFEQHYRFLEADRGDLLVEARSRNTSRTDEVIEIVTDARLGTSIRALDVLTPPNPDPKPLVSSITAPILLVRGERGIVSLQLARELAALNPDVRLETIQDAGHALPYDEPGKLSHLVKRFWADIDSPD